MDSQRSPMDLNWNPESIDLETQSEDPIEVELGEAQGLEDGKVYKTGRWSLAETLFLCHSKRVDYEKHGPTKSQRLQMTTAPNRWKAMADDLWEKGVHRNPQQIQDKWEQLSPDFKKVYDYEKKIPSGQPSYFSMSPLEKKNHPRKFPRAPFDQTVYEAMLEWFPKVSQAVDAGDLPLDSGTMAPPPDGGESSIDYSTKKRRLSMKAADGALASMDKTRLEFVQAISGGHDREDMRHKEIMELDRQKLQCEELRHLDTMKLERERMDSASASTQGYVNALLSLSNAMKTIGDALSNRK